MALLNVLCAAAMTLSSSQSFAVLPVAKAAGQRTPPAQTASAQQSFKHALAASELVFIGKVENIEYALSEPCGMEQRRLPYTFVTYRVGEVLRGDYDAPTLTLRFIGGLNRNTMRVMTTSHTPSLDIGDEDLLLVSGNGSEPCPLVGCTDGRFRIIDSQIYTEMGRSVMINQYGGIDFGPRYGLHQVQTTTIQGRSFGRRLGSNLLPLPSQATSVADFTALIHALTISAGPANQFVTVDIARPFLGPIATPAAPPAIRPSESSDQPPEQSAEKQPRRGK